MKIALLTDGIYPYVIGGMQKHSYYLVKYLLRNKIYVDLYHTNQSVYDINVLEFFSSDEKKFLNSFVIDFPRLDGFPGHYIRESYAYSENIFKLFKANSEVDFIYVKGLSGWKLIQEKKKGYKCSPIGVNFHGYEMFQRAANLTSWIEQILLLRRPVLYNIKNADYAFSYGGKISDIIKNIGIDKSRIVEVPTGIERDWLNEQIKKTERIRRFAFVGRYERRKGVEELTKALIRILPENEFEFHFVGPIPEKKKIISNKVIYHGVITNVDDIKSILCSCDVFVCPSYSEGMPNVILEAMASGLAVIATNVGAVSLMVSKKNGWLIDSPDTQIVYETILQSINTPSEQLVAMKQNSLNAVKECFLWEKIIVDTIDAIKKRS